MRFARTALCVVASMCFAHSVSADRIETAQGVVSDITIQTIRGAEIYYQDARGGLERMPVSEVRTLGFEGLPPLDAAERAWQRGETNTAIENWLRASVASRTEPQRLWIHARLAIAHDKRGEFVQAAGHAARVMLVDASPYWANIAPKSDANDPDQTATLEAWWAIDRLSRRNLPPELKAVAERLATAVGPIHDRVQQAQPSVTWRDGSSVSGFSVNDIRRPDWHLPPSATDNTITPIDAPTQPSNPTRAPSTPTPTPVDNGPDSPAMIDRLLREQKFTEAVTVCERVARRPGDRSLAEFLLQYGRSLAGANRPRDAAIRYMQCAIHFEGSNQAPEALLETAVIYRSTLNQPETAQRLLDRAMTMAQARGLDDLILKVRSLRGSGS